eukprot:CAMPEP_0119116450 /NCGR_PEP_ID=MMETSP1180-20130426/52292_1 /TAXON_ID=3052 ORGANISM="Chlamydomonas cf sp, Strain CCMP681" /NCGR_SAMPLE_ID=MMETSP1180 /ASSEMBLY_ACC=CAM_ASM_000741 /LENGTH=103 /DNA_ID=CAMNT_0007105599 /DNA_START=732 /DNA_END=1043 /DNA_ORIENTATION=+
MYCSRRSSSSSITPNPLAWVAQVTRGLLLGLRNPASGVRLAAGERPPDGLDTGFLLPNGLGGPSAVRAPAPPNTAMGGSFRTIPGLLGSCELAGRRGCPATDR